MTPTELLALLERVASERARDAYSNDTLPGGHRMLEDTEKIKALRTLGDELPAEMTRVRDEVLGQHLACMAKEETPSGRMTFMPAITRIRNDLDAAARALAGGDVAAMMRIYVALKGWKP